jgi:hypothetical protein
MTTAAVSLTDRRRRKKLAAMPHNPEVRGYHVVYRRHETNFCPGCGRAHWYLGRLSAECAFCATALPFESGRA